MGAIRNIMRTIEFGRYRKNDTGPAVPIEWLVLQEDEDTMFLVTQHAVAKRCFDEDYQTWKDSEIRKWLNESFYERAFSVSEKQCIQPTQIEVMDWEGSIIEQSTDAIFLLGMKEYKMYVSTQSEEWWLRDRGVCDSTAILALQDGSFDAYANAHSIYGIRPAMRIVKNYEELVIPEIPILEGQMMLFDDGNHYDEDVYMEIEIEVERILTQLGMDPLGNRRDFKWLKEVILYAIFHPDAWQESYLEVIGIREGITRERVRQILFKAVWDHWTPRSVHILSEHFGYPIRTQFEYVKPNHMEFITLLSKQLRRKYKIM